ncbi:MAG TPA: hypothetical protein VGH57_10895 [Amycolatopsis sp.]
MSVATRSPLMLSLARYFAVSARPDQAARFVTSLLEPVVSLALAGGTVRYLRRAVTTAAA